MLTKLVAKKPKGNAPEIVHKRLICILNRLTIRQGYYREIQKKLTNAKGHLKTLRSSEGPSTPKGASACPTGVWLWPLSSGPGGQGLVSWVFPFGVVASIDRYRFVLTNAGLADGADLTLGPGFQPGSQAGPTEEVSTHGYNGVCGHI